MPSGDAGIDGASPECHVSIESVDTVDIHDVVKAVRAVGGIKGPVLESADGVIMMRTAIDCRTLKVRYGIGKPSP